MAEENYFLRRREETNPDGCRSGEMPVGSSPDVHRETLILGTMDERFLLVREFDLQSFHLGLFWKEVNQKLDGLSLEPAVREELEHRSRKRSVNPL